VKEKSVKREAGNAKRKAFIRDFHITFCGLLFTIYDMLGLFPLSRVTSHALRLFRYSAFVISSAIFSETGLNLYSSAAITVKDLTVLSAFRS